MLQEKTPEEKKNWNPKLWEKLDPKRIAIVQARKEQVKPTLGTSLD